MSHQLTLYSRKECCLCDDMKAVIYQVGAKAAVQLAEIDVDTSTELQEKYGSEVPVLFIGLVAFQVRSIVRSRYPGLRAIEALATSVPLFLLLFASVYVVMSTSSAGNFGQQLTHTDALYFAVTVFSTVGFGDIVAKTEVARLVVTAQMIADLLIIGLGLRVILGAVTRGRQQRPADAGTARPGE